MDPGDLDPETFFATLERVASASASANTDEEDVHHDENMRAIRRQKQERALESSQWLKHHKPEEFASVMAEVEAIQAQATKNPNKASQGFDCARTSRTSRQAHDSAEGPTAYYSLGQPNSAVVTSAGPITKMSSSGSVKGRTESNNRLSIPREDAHLTDTLKVRAPELTEINQTPRFTLPGPRNLKSRSPQTPSPGCAPEVVIRRSPRLKEKAARTDFPADEHETLSRDSDNGDQGQRKDNNTRSFSQATTASHISDDKGDRSEDWALLAISGEASVLEAQIQQKKIRARSPERTPQRPDKRSLTARPTPELPRRATEPFKPVDIQAEGKSKRLKRTAFAGEPDDEPSSRPRPPLKSARKANEASKQFSTTGEEGTSHQDRQPEKQSASLKSSLLANHVLYYMPRGIDSQQTKRKLTAESHGATIVDDLDSEVTHIVADGDYWRSWNFERLQQQLEGYNVPPNVQFVDVWYIPDCLRARRVLDIKEGVARIWLGKGSNQQLLGRDSRLGYRVPGSQQFLEALSRDTELKRREREEFFGTATPSTNLERSSEPPTPLGEVPDSQPSPLKTPQKAKSMPPPESPASLQLKPDSRRCHGTPSLARLSSEHVSDLDSFLMRKQPKPKIVIPTTPRRKCASRQRQEDEIADVEETPERRCDTPSSSDSIRQAPARSIQESRLRGDQGTIRRGDELDEAIEKAREREGESEAEDEDEDRYSKSEDGEELRQFENAKKDYSMASSDSWQRKFACMHGGKAREDAAGPNATVIEKLKEMADYYERIKEPWKGPAYRKAIKSLENTDKAITTKSEANQIPGIGGRLAEDIEEIAQTKSLRRLKEAKSNKSDQILQTFLQVYGAGLTVAREWMKQGLRTLDDVRTKAKLSKNQQIGLEHYDDFLSRIPRSEVASHEALVKLTLAEISSDLEVTIGGSYRRGAESCGDVDFLISSKVDNVNEETLRMIIFKELLPRLSRIGYIRCSLATNSANGGSKWHGAAALPGDTIWRRVDFLVVPWKEWGAALIYFTGNDVFNRSMRLLASKKGMRLNQHGLYIDVIRGPNRVKLTDGQLLEGRNERRIFDILGVPYRPPEERVI